MCAEPRQPCRLERRGVSVFKLTAPLLSRLGPSSAPGHGSLKRLVVRMPPSARPMPDMTCPPAPVDCRTPPLRLTTSLTNVVDTRGSNPSPHALCCLGRLQRMEPLWSPVVATGGNRSQTGSAPRRLKQAKTFAVGCDRLPRDGKEGVDGSSPSEGSAKAPARGLSVRVDLYFARRHAETNKVVIAGCDEAKLERAARRSRAASEQRRPLSQLPTDL
jgi:hypothetical protein